MYKIAQASKQQQENLKLNLLDCNILTAVLLHLVRTSVRAFVRACRESRLQRLEGKTTTTRRENYNNWEGRLQ